jgi:hypothetical protein
MTPAMNFRQAALLAIALATLAGCEPEKRDPNDPVAQAEKRGADDAGEIDLKRVSDCGSLEDMDERQGCAKWVNSRDDEGN